MIHMRVGLRRNLNSNAIMTGNLYLYVSGKGMYSEDILQSG